MKTGIEASSEDLNQRKIRYGNNEIKPRKATTCCQLLLEPFEDRILQILIGACIIQLVIGIIENGPAGAVDGISIFIAIMIITLVTAGNNWKKEK
jgi:magnesium-transporting ATPase (P-type)